MSLSTTFLLPAPLDLAATLSPVRHGFGDPTIRIAGDEALHASRTPEGPSTLHVRVRGIEVEGRAWGPGARWALEHAPDLLGARDDREAFSTSHPLVGRLNRRFGGLRLCRSDRVLETLFPTILEQKITSHQARAAFRGLVLRYGEPAPGPGNLRLQPAPQRLAALPYWAFHPFGIARTRAETIRTVCARAGRLEGLVSLAPREAAGLVSSLPGVGPWTTGYVMATAFGDPDAVVVGDLHLPHIVTWALAREPRGSDERMLELLSGFPGQRGRVMRLIAGAGFRPPVRGPRRRLHRIEAH